jgi:hypothetical protein
MITPSHVVYSLAAAVGLKSNLSKKVQLLAVTLGAILPDTPAYIFFLVQGVLLQTPHTELWDILYFDSAWTPFITLSHSFILWPILAVLAFTFKKRFIAWLAASAVLHIIMDFFVHSSDAYAHFWPLSNWKFESPLSYWNPAHYGNIVGTLDTVIVLLLLVYLLKQATSKTAKYSIIFLCILYILMAITQISTYM